MSQSFVHLHNHTEYSMLDGAAKVAPMLAEAQRLEMPAIGMTHHGNMFGASGFCNGATAAGITPIIGIEAYIAPGSRFETRCVLWGDPGQASDDVSGRSIPIAQVSPHDVAEAAIGGKRSVVPGIVPKAVSIGGRFMPRTLLLPGLRLGNRLRGGPTH